MKNYIWSVLCVCVYLRGSQKRESKMAKERSVGALSQLVFHDFIVPSKTSTSIIAS